ncbi:hypothetical protein [Amycolatopsis sp. SID8362]|uniref:hypothetical protein n=1 Tax=Amycolatopsis sp. SID8362 TaxID=2690346 RepID=UPI00136B943B|nr:hypothetical protein [Amycolatopsis sp. SID8362]NBH12431.1 hypothetical protein [Amycolatopsis sp. SID8362]NED49123.1 hypothetical protein [Amycolatopsis sp. SID8362]
MDSSEVPDGQGWATGGFVEFRSNLDYAKDLVKGGQHLERLQVGAFDVADLIPRGVGPGRLGAGSLDPP